MLEGGNPGVSLPLHSVWERMYAGGGGGGGGGGDPAVSLPLHNVCGRGCMLEGGGGGWCPLSDTTACVRVSDRVGVG